MGQYTIESDAYSRNKEDVPPLRELLRAIGGGVILVDKVHESRPQSHTEPQL
mgnify:CR=1 FL=1